MTTLPKPISAYLAAANAHDSQATAACFTTDAIVRDEHREWRGADAIRAWKEEVDRKYQPITDPIRVTQVNRQTVVTARVSGDFPGSPIELPYRFTLQGDKITLLEID
jgi:ketosteroid isomerase-like protein